MDAPGAVFMSVPHMLFQILLQVIVIAEPDILNGLSPQDGKVSLLVDGILLLVAHGQMVRHHQCERCIGKAALHIVSLFRRCAQQLRHPGDFAERSTLPGGKLRPLWRL